MLVSVRVCAWAAAVSAEYSYLLFLLRCRMLNCLIAYSAIANKINDDDDDDDDDDEKVFSNAIEVSLCSN